VVYDAAGNFAANVATYDVTGQQVSYPAGGMTHSYDGDGLRAKKTENGAATYSLRSSVLGGQVVAEINWFSVAWGWNRGYVYLGSQLLAVQQGGVNWMHEDPVTKSKRVTNSSGAVVSTIELDPWGAGTSRSINSAFQPRRFTSYTNDFDGGDDAMMRRYSFFWSRFSQPDPHDGSYDLSNPQSFNRYAYVQNDPVNFVDPTGLNEVIRTYTWDWSPWNDPLFWRYMFWTPDSGGSSGGGDPIGGGLPGDDLPKSPGRDEKDINDCKTFAAMVQNIANLSKTPTEFLDKMATTFTAAAIQNSSISEMNRTQNMRSRINFGDSGFKPQFQDGGNQVRHFVAGFIAGVKAAPFEWYARQRMNERENPNNPLDRADINLNKVLRNGRTRRVSLPKLLYERQLPSEAKIGLSRLVERGKRIRIVAYACASSASELEADQIRVW
jgi:RHS repeat-associated protein